MPPSNLLELFLKNVQKLGDQPCLQFKRDGKWDVLSWNEVTEEVQKIALGLRALGIKKGDRVGLFSSTRVEWTLCDLAILSLGAVTVPIYPSSTAEQAAYILGNSGARLVFVETEAQYGKIISMKGRLPDLEKMILIDAPDSGDPAAFEFARLREIGGVGEERSWQKGVEGIGPNDTATISYTSGTTGPPKGAVLTHGNFIAEVEALMRLFDRDSGDVYFLYLPLAHIFARAMQFWQLGAGHIHAYAENLEKMFENLQEVRPHFFSTVPRILEKIYERFHRQDPSGVRNLFGNRFCFAISGGAPLSREIAEFLYKAGILILEGYGLTETTAGIFINSDKSFRFGTVGKVLHRMEVKIASDGEIVVRGPMIFQGYYKDPQATREVLSEEGWFKTGDIGEIDSDGFLRITDRKKDIIITSAGKNIAPQNIENLLKTIPCLSQAIVFGDRKKYLVALVTLNREFVEKQARANGISFSDFRELCQHPRVSQMVQEAIEEKNKNLASFETIKRFAILENDFSQEANELTPTMKVRRRFVSEKYREILDWLYLE